MAGPPAQPRALEEVGGIARIEHLAGREDPRDPVAVVGGRERVDAERASVLVHADDRQTARDGRRRDPRRAIVRAFDDHGAVAELAGRPLLGVCQQQASGRGDRERRAALGPLAEDLLERVDREHARERHVRTLREPAQVGDALRKRDLCGRRQRREPRSQLAGRQLRALARAVHRRDGARDFSASAVPT